MYPSEQVCGSPHSGDAQQSEPESVHFDVSYVSSNESYSNEYEAQNMDATSSLMGAEQRLAHSSPKNGPHPSQSSAQ